MKQFVDYYYSTFDTNRQGLAGLYQDSSMMSFEGQEFQGQQAIGQKLMALPFQQCKHSVVEMDVQPSPSGGILVFVVGHLMVENEERPLKFSQVFQLMSAGNSFFVQNDMFRLN